LKIYKSGYLQAALIKKGRAISDTEKSKIVSLEKLMLKSATTSSRGYNYGPWKGPGHLLLGVVELKTLNRFI